jgi:hypothetical protein
MVAAACTGRPPSPGSASNPDEAVVLSTRAPASDDGTFLRQIDPLGGHWEVVSVGDEDFTGWKSWVSFGGGADLNHGAGCGGGHSAFYRLDGDLFEALRQEPVNTGLCSPAPAA